ncbi:sensor histidine kinase [Magnetospirillum sulfuroxidans]|uniref:histidine kinase n=1 Tax=Magnetospirillum sulfuroxidans TaxID=611300 RepID=A0ABS5I826_9PROT|nr:HAMP domain-containing histidine kinase [Magnetospirillum sulfuroxidans]
MKLKSPPSLMGRIVLRLFLATLAAVIFAYGWLWVMFQTTTGNLRDQSLIETARTIIHAVKADPDGKVRVDLPDTLIASYAQSKGVHGFAVRDRLSGLTLFAVGADVGPLPAKIDEDEDGSLYQYDPDGPGPESYFGEAFPFQLGPNRLVVQVVRLGSDYQELIETVITDFFEDGGWLAGPFLLLLMGVSILTIRGTLAPLRSLSQQAETIGPNATDIRLPRQGVPREVLPLVSAVNNALERLEDGFRLQREFTADAAHELRTPLAVLTAHIDTLTDPAIAAPLRRDLESMTHLVEQLLRVARVEALVVTPSDRADLGEIACNVAAYLALVAIRSGRTIEVDAPDQPVLVHGQADALFHAVRNLVDNALRHTPIGTAVILTALADPPTLFVRDHGTGIAVERRADIFKRFWRSDRRTAGAGLGLAIVQRTLEAHGGAVLIEDAEGGGAQFRLVFPKP